MAFHPMPADYILTVSHLSQTNHTPSLKMYGIDEGREAPLDFADLTPEQKEEHTWKTRKGYTIA